MKKHLFLQLLLFISMASAIDSKAQYNSLSNVSTTVLKSGKPLQDPVSRLVQIKFHLAFPDVVDEQWIKSRDGYTVRFADNGIQNWVHLNKRGNIVGKMRYYLEKDLPSSVGRLVKSNYYGFTITSVKEITKGFTTTYLVTIEDEETWKVIQVIDRDLEIYEDHLKAK